MNTVIVSTLSEFIEETEFPFTHSELIIYRGQHKRGNLLPGIARKNPGTSTTQKEKKLLAQLKLQGASMIEDAGETDLDLLVYAQHHGLETRLLDWTSNPLVALWFACSSQNEGDVYVYALEADTLSVRDAYATDPFQIRKTRVLQPRLNNVRIIAQQGWFTLHIYSSKIKKFVPLEKNSDIKRHLSEIQIPATKRRLILYSLERHGVSAKTIYPDFSGLCQYLNWKHNLTSQRVLKKLFPAPPPNSV